MALALVAITIGASLALSACSGGSTPSPAEGAGKNTVLTIASPSPPGSLDPSREGGATAAFQLVAYQGLLSVGAPGKPPAPSLAESYEWVGGGPEVTLKMKLRKGLKFSDGTVMDSAAVKTSIEHFASAQGAQAYVALPIKSMDTPDELTIVFNLSAPTPTFLSDLTEGSGLGSIISPKALAENPKGLGTSTAGAGPYVLTRTGTIEGSEYHYLPNEHYYNPEGIKYKEVVFKIIADPNTALAALQSGQVNITYGFPDTFERAKGAGLQAAVYNDTVNGLWLQDWNGKVVPALKELGVRQAINYALDREAISKADTKGLGIATAQAPPANSMGNDKSLDKAYPYDTEKARKLLADAGYANGFELPVIIPGFIPTASLVAQAAADQLAKVGIKLVITKATTFPEYAKGQESGVYAATVFPLGFVPGMPSVMTSLYDPKGLINPMRNVLPDVVAAADKAAATPGDAAAGAWVEVNKLVVDGAYSAPITSEPVIWYHDKSLSNLGNSFTLNVVNFVAAS